MYIKDDLVSSIRTQQPARLTRVLPSLVSIPHPAHVPATIVKLVAISSSDDQLSD